MTTTSSDNGISTTFISNDLVKNVRFSDSVAHLTAEYSNFLTSGWTEIDGVSYIDKTWVSPLREVFIYVPTTNTYYLNHVVGSPDCSYAGEYIKRKNLPDEISATTINPNKYCTKFRLRLDNEYFNFNRILNIYANGNSLPLKIYRDDIYVDNKKDTGYHSVVLPTVSLNNLAIDVPYANDSISGLYNFTLSDDQVILEFACFGTDS